MATFIATIKAIITRLVFAAHAFLAIWQVTIFKSNTFYWYLSSPILLLFFEGVFTLTIKESQEWKWFCPSVFLYLVSIVPAIWLLELDKVDRRLRIKEETFNLTANANNFKELHNLIGVEIKLPEIALSTETWITLLEQFLMLILIIGRWMLPKGDLTRDELSQLLLVYIGTAADIIEFFDSFKDNTIASEPILVLLTLAIWSWSLMQFTVVLTATKARKSRLSTTKTVGKGTKSCCCSIDVWGIALNITLQDAPFLVFRLLIITHFNIISYMNVFFTCKNTLVILLQLYRLYVVHSENNKPKKKRTADFELTDISIISKGDIYHHRPRKAIKSKPTKKSRSTSKSKSRTKSVTPSQSDTDDFSEGTGSERLREARRKKIKQHSKKDTGYSTASSHTSARKAKRDHNVLDKSRKTKSKPKKLKRSETNVSQTGSETEPSTEPERIEKDVKQKKKKKVTKVITTSSATTRSGDSD